MAPERREPGIERAGHVAGIDLGPEVPQRPPERPGALPGRHARGDVGPGERPGQTRGRVGAAGKALVDAGEVGESERGAQVRGGAGGAAVEAERHPLALDAQIGEADAAAEEVGAALHGEGSPEDPVGGRQAGAEAPGARVEIGAHALARTAAEARREAGLAGPGEVDEAREGGEIRRAGVEGAVDRPGPEAPAIGRLEGRRRDPQDLRIAGAVGAPGAVHGDLRPAAERPGEALVRRRDALGPGIGADREAPRGVRIGRRRQRVDGEVRLEAAEPALRGGDPGRREAPGHPRRRGGPVRAPVEHEARDLDAAGAGDSAGSRQRPGGRGHVEDPVRRERALDQERGRLRGELDSLRLDRAAAAQRGVAGEPRRAGEDRRDDGREQALDPRREVEGQAPVGAGADEARLAVRADLGPGREGEGRAPVVEDALPLQVEAHRRQAGHVGEAGQEAARRLVEVEPEVEALALRHEAEPRREAAGARRAGGRRSARSRPSLGGPSFAAPRRGEPRGDAERPARRARVRQARRP